MLHVIVTTAYHTNTIREAYINLLPQTPISTTKRVGLFVLKKIHRCLTARNWNNSVSQYSGNSLQISC